MRFGKAMALAGMFCAFATAAFAGDASDFTLRDVEGQQVSLSQYQGQVVVMSFWATWCGPCKVEMPHLNDMYVELKDKGLVVLSIATDDARTASQAKMFVKKNGYAFPVLLDTESTVSGVYNPTATLPYTVIIDKQGNKVKEHSGYNPGDEVGLRKEIDELLAKP
jgi:peroxiredoxin